MGEGGRGRKGERWDSLLRVRVGDEVRKIGGKTDTGDMERLDRGGDEEEGDVGEDKDKERIVYRVVVEEEVEET